VTGFLLDTNIVSEFRKRSRADAGVLSWVAENQAEDFWLSVLVVGELRRGVELVRRRDDMSAVLLAAWLDSVVADYGDRILPVPSGICDQ
jgi:predicted nucleic acid-binding protein